MDTLSLSDGALPARGGAVFRSGATFLRSRGDLSVGVLSAGSRWASLSSQNTPRLMMTFHMYTHTIHMECHLLTKRQQTIGSYPEIPYSEFCLSRLRICFQQSPKITTKKTIIVGPPRLASSTPCWAAPVPPTNGVLYPVRLVLAYPGPDPVNLRRMQTSPQKLYTVLPISRRATVWDSLLGPE